MDTNLKIELKSILSSVSFLFLLSMTSQAGVSIDYSLEFLAEVCHPVLQLLTLFETLKSHFYTRFQTWPLRNYVIIAQIRTPTGKILKIHFEFTYFSFSLIQLELKR